MLFYVIIILLIFMSKKIFYFINFIINKFQYSYTLSLNIDYKTFEEIIKKNKNNDEIEFIIKKYDKNNKLVCEKKYNNYEYLGSGTYAKVFRLSYKNNFDFIIKFGIAYPDATYDEAVILDDIYTNSEIDDKYKYKIESYGTNKIIIDSKIINNKYNNGDDNNNYKEISFIIMPYLGELDLYGYMNRIHTNNFNTDKLPIVLKNVINNLIELNKHYLHNDIKTDNIMINLTDYSIKIIDFGLCCKNYKMYTTLGYRQILPEFIINSFDSDYLITYKMVSQIDNFGLFWMILDCFTNEKLFKKYIKIVIKDHSKNSYKSTLNFYLNLFCISKNSLSHKIRNEMIDYTYKNIKNDFIEDVYNMTSPYIKNKLFSNKNEFVKFIEKMLLLVSYDYNNRLSLEEFIKETFFIIK